MISPSTKNAPVYFGNLIQEIDLLNLSDHTPVRHGLTFLILILALMLSFGVLLYTNSLWWQIGNGVFMAFITVQIALVGHDCSHGQIFSSWKHSRAAGRFILTLFCGVSEAGWYEKHNAHHKHVNRQDRDPDLGIPFIFSPIQAATKGPLVRRYIRPYQHLLFFLALPFVYPNFIFWTFKRFFAKWNRATFFEFLFLCAHFLLWVALPVLVLPLPVAIVFIGVQFAIIGIYMSVAFAPNHKGELVTPADEETTWRHQIELTRNLAPSRFRFFLLGGLDYQIEHHLFPTMSRFHYPRIQPVVKRFCDTHGLRYHETSWWGSMREIYRALKENRI